MKGEDMVNEFCGFKHGVIGTDKMPADTTLNNMKKEDLIKLLHTAQHNYESLMWFYNNTVKVNMRSLEEMKEIRAKAIDEFAEKLNTDVESFEAEVNGIRADLLTLDYFSEFVFEIAEQLKGGAT